MHVSTVPCLPCIWYCKYAEYACKLQTNLSMNNKQWHNMQTNAISYYKYVEYAGICQKKSHEQQKTTWSLKLTEYAETMQYRHPPIQEHLVYSHLICMYMYIYVIYVIYAAHIYVCIMPLSDVTILFNQHFIIMGNIVGKSRRAF